MQKQVRMITQPNSGSKKSAAYGITLEKEIAIFASGIFYKAEWMNGDILLVSGTNLKPDMKTIRGYKFEECKIEVKHENSNT